MKSILTDLLKILELSKCQFFKTTSPSRRMFPDIFQNREGEVVQAGGCFQRVRISTYNSKLKQRCNTISHTSPLIKSHVYDTTCHHEELYTALETL